MSVEFRELPDFDHFLCRITTAASLDDLSAIVAEMRVAYGLAHIVYHAVHIPGGVPANPILIPTYSPEWVERYKAGNYFRIDPVVLAGRKNSLPVDWSDVDHESKEAREFFKQADRFEVGRHGVTLPIRAAAGERGLLTITSNKSVKNWQRVRGTYIREFQTFASYLHDRACILSGYRSTDDGAALSPRELQCLELMAHGFAPKRTAEHLGITDDAVRMYLRSACCKLKCATSHQAIAKLIHREIIDPQVIYN
ncbi:MAG: autoinducer binding domain-containing protein [Proteobacteria bacterium]|nr:autoinducer binding domain-containing protein [Pseudomonadota bacterium]